MSIGFLFWLLMVLSLFGWGWGRPWSAGGWGWAGNFILYICIFLLGWKVFGFVIHN